MKLPHNEAEILIFLKFKILTSYHIIISSKIILRERRFLICILQLCIPVTNLIGNVEPDSEQTNLKYIVRISI